MTIWNVALRVLTMFEDVLVRQLVRSPTFNHGVKRVHRAVHEYRHGRNPEEMRQGEASRDPSETERNDNGFMKHFVEELRNQARGTPTDPPPPPPRNQQPPSR